MERLIGATTLDAARFIVGQNPKISAILYRKYTYQPAVESGREDIIPIQRGQFLEGVDPVTILSPNENRTNIALDSTVDLSNGENGYFLMMDFTPIKSPENQRYLEGRLRSLILPNFGGGFLLETRRSYHFLGQEIVNWNTWLDFLGRCLITSEVIEGKGLVEVADTRYIGFSLLRRSTGLRLTTRGTKLLIPKVVAVLD